VTDNLTFLLPDGSPDYAAINGSSPLLLRMGIVLTEATPDRLVATMPVEGNTQPYGLLHGGASVVLAETLGSFGAMFVAGPGRVAVGVDINATHHRAVRSGSVTGVATPIHRGKTVTTWEVVISDDSGARVCTCRISCLLREAVAS
jgi:1,4-dihydroxy-2-naphthoyl-CoA hydrolase